jgi:hypothetical protein
VSIDMLQALNEAAANAAKEDEAQRKTDSKNANDSHQRALEVQSLTTHPGWKHFMRSLDASARMAWAKVVGAPDQFHQTKAVGELDMILRTQQWAKAVIESAAEPAPPQPR